MASAPPRSSIPRLTELPLVIESPRLQLRPAEDADAEALFQFVSDPEMTRYITWAAHTSVEQTREWVRSRAEQISACTDITWTIVHGGVPVGCIGLHGIEWGHSAVRYDRADLGFWIGRAYAGQGLMTEAATLATRWAFETLGLHKVRVVCFEENVASRRVIEKVGFRSIGRSEEDIWRDGRWYAHLEFELVVSEWGDSTRTQRFMRTTS